MIQSEFKQTSILDLFIFFSLIGTPQEYLHLLSLLSSVEWLQSKGYSTSFASAELADPDGDGIPNWQEYYAGTDPNNSNSAFRVMNIQSNGL